MGVYIAPGFRRERPFLEAIFWTKKKYIFATYPKSKSIMHMQCTLTLCWHKGSVLGFFFRWQIHFFFFRFFFELWAYRGLIYESEFKGSLPRPVRAKSSLSFWSIHIIMVWAPSLPGTVKLKRGLSFCTILSLLELWAYRELWEWRVAWFSA